MNSELLWKKYNDYIAYGIRLLWWLRFTLPIRFFFYTQYLWFSVSLSTFMAVLWTWVSMLFEVPTGTWADKYGRKPVLILWMSLSIIWFLPYILTKDIRVLVMWSIIWGIWSAIISWCLWSLIYDWYKWKWEVNKYKDYTRLSSSMVFIWRSLATIIWWWLFVQNPLYPYYALLVCMILQWLLSLILYEPPYEKEMQELSTKQYIIDWRKYLTSSYSLNTILLWFSIWYFFASLIWWLYQPFMEYNWLNIEQISWFYAWASFISFLWSYATKHRYKEEYSETKITVGYLLLIVLTWFSFLLLEWYGIYIWIIFIQIAFWAHNPIVINAINHTIPSSHRATANSIHSLIDSGWWFLWWGICWLMATYLWYSWTWLLVVLSCLWLVGMMVVRWKKKGVMIVVDWPKP